MIKSQRSRIIVSLSLILSLIFLTGCPKGSSFTQRTVKTNDQVGSCHVTVIAVAPWNTFVSELKPNFNLAIDKALDLADYIVASVNILLIP